MGPDDEADNLPQPLAQDAVAERLARLENEVASLRAELAALQSTGTTEVAASRVAPPFRNLPPRPTEAARVSSAPSIAAARSIAAAPSAAAAPSVAQRNASLESQLGSRVLSKVAIVLLLAGTAWFLKWAFDNRWIGPQGRVVVGLIAGIAIILWSERFRRQKMAAFSYALKAVGSGVLYLSLWASFQLYRLVPASVALMLMIGVTAWNAFMAWSQDALVLAAYALLGGYLTPLLLSTGGDHETFLFTYLLALALSLLALLGSKPWSLLLLAALPATTLYFVGWYAEFFSASNAALTAGFALLLWAAFAAVALVAKRAEGLIVSIFAPLAAALFGALTIYSILMDNHASSWEPWAAVAFAAAYLGLTRLRSGLIAAVHLGLAVVFLIVAIPLKATGRGVTVGWLVEAVALLAVTTVDGIEDRTRMVLRWLGATALVLGAGEAMLNPLVLGAVQPAFFNREFATEMAAVAALLAAIVLGRRMAPEPGERLRGSDIAAASFLMANVVLLFALHHEIFRAFLSAQPDWASWATGREHARFTYSGWMALQGTAVLVLGFVRREALARWTGLVLLAATVAKTLALDLGSLGTGYRVISYLGLGVLFMAVSFAYQKDWLGLRDAASAEDDAVPGGDV
jgi:uncharacterized membrane protein